MAELFSFDAVSKVDLQEAENAVNIALKELANRYDFKGSKSRIEWAKAEGAITLIGDDEFKLNQLREMLEGKVVKRGIALNALDYGKIEPAAGATVRQVAKLKQGIPQEKAKAMVAKIKASGLKVQAQIQSEQVRVSGKSKDELQAVMQLLRGAADLDLPLQFTNYR